MDIITVGLDERSYPIHIGAGVLGTIGELCRTAQLSGTAAVVTNPTVAAHYLAPVRESLVAAGYRVVPVIIPDGEENKNSETLNAIYDALIAGDLERGSFIVALGGGVVGDIAGFAAASYLRGIPFVQVPTTLLAQVDSSVGGKTGINHARGKNLIGAFYQPRLVLIDTNTLDTLPDREHCSGLAEAAKYGVVLDHELFALMRQECAALLARDKQVLQQVVAASCRLKARIVEQDEREGGLRAVLNYGHTLGHAVETLTGYREFLHGEAIAIGMFQAARFSETMGFATADDTRQIRDLLVELQLPVELPTFPAAAYEQALLRDKKRRDGGIQFVFNRNIGDFCIEQVTDLRFLLTNCGIGE
ncbi:MAG TPA: 3-dehydroquinate synthase [Geobacteraceae bacterium]